MDGEKKLNILIVDDDIKYLILEKTALKDEGYNILTSSSGYEAIEIANEHEINIALLDINMEDIKGFEVCKKMRQNYHMRPLQIVFISGFTEEEYLSQAIEAGGDDFIKKPVSPLELQARIKAAVIRFNNQKALYKEREFYMKAVKQEEDLASKILDQNLFLRKAYKNMEHINKELEEANHELKKIARYDMLSGVLNRMSLFAMMDIEIERALRTNTSLSGIMMDLDHFKHVNDNYGHPCGDEVIRMAGRLLKEHLRKYDHAGRYGGEEFFIILPNTTLDQAFMIADRFRQQLENTPVNYGSDELHITASMGVVEFKANESREKWISRADVAMYIAKQKGRNQVVKN